MTIEQVQNSIEKACKRIAPAWPLENSVAVNPYLGLSDKTFEQAAEILKYRGDIQLYMPLDFYLKQIKEVKICFSDIEKALETKNRDESVNEFLNQVKYLSEKDSKKQKIATLTNIAEANSGGNFSEVMINQISEWMASYFNKAEETSPEQMFQLWKSDASLDLMPEFSGIKNFRSSIKIMPNNSRSAILVGLEKLNIPKHLVEIYLHSLLLKSNWLVILLRWIRLAKQSLW